MTTIRKNYYALIRWFFPSPAEKRFMRVMGFWYFIRYTVKREYRLGGYYIDFALPREHIVLEIDGKHYHGGSKDILRDEAIRKLGWHVLRIPAESLWREPARVRREVYQFTKNPQRWAKIHRA